MTIPGPRSGDDTYDLIDDALAALAERRGACLGDELAAITLIASLIDQAERFLPELVTSARAQRPQLGPDRPGPGHQPRRGTAPLRPPIPDRRRQVALRPLAPPPPCAGLRWQARHSPVAATSPPAKPQVQRPQRSEDERPGGAASGGHNRRRGRPQVKPGKTGRPRGLTNIRASIWLPPNAELQREEPLQEHGDAA
jgi:hypothetical protein